MASIKDKLKAKRRAARDERILPEGPLTNRVLPLAAYYGGDPEREAQRRRSYLMCARAFRDWTEMEFRLPEANPALKFDVTAGHGERGREVAAIQRDRTIAINLKSAPFEWLSSKGMLETKVDHAGIGNIRFSAGMEFRDLLVGAEPMGLKSANLEGASGGGGVPIIINDFKMDCIHTINGIKVEMLKHQPARWGRLTMPTGNGRKAWIAERYGSDRPMLFDLLHRLIYSDEWLFESLPRRKHKAVMEQIHNGLDQVAVYLGLLIPREYDARWRPSSSRADARRSPRVPY